MNNTILFEQPCVAHREDLGIDDACKHVSLMTNIETFLRTVYTLFSISTASALSLSPLTTAVVFNSHLSDFEWEFIQKAGSYTLPVACRFG